MRTRMMIVFAALLFFSTSERFASRADDAPDKNKKLIAVMKGKWQLTSRIEDGVETDAKIVKNRTMVVEDGKYTLYNGDEVHLTTQFKVDATRKPAWYDLPDPEFNELGIIKIEDDVLTICLGPKDGARPTEFKSPEGKDWVLVVYKRVKK